MNYILFESDTAGWNNLSQRCSWWSFKDGIPMQVNLVRVEVVFFGREENIYIYIYIYIYIKIKMF